jgi:hypothetical protein
VTYINGLHPLERLFDGFIAFTWFGSRSSVDDPAVLDISARFEQIISQPTRIRDDLDVPVMVVNSECETLTCVPVRQLDTDRFRFWEVAGAPHGPRLHMERIIAKMVRDGRPPPGELTDASILHPVPFAPVLDAAVAHVHGWMHGGPPPPSQPRIEVDGDPARIRRDSDGNAIGGVRVPEMEATLTRNIGAMQEAGEMGLFGAWSPLPTATVRERYADHAAYVQAFEKAAQAAVDAGVLRPRDAADAVERAKATALP